MRTTFFGLEIARKGLQTSQRSLDVTGHNIANANTPGFTRQRAIIGTTTPWTVPSMQKPHQAGQVGTGVQVEEIRRIRDQFIDLQVRNENKELGYWSERADVLQKIEVIINEPSTTGLRTVMDQFWESMQELSKSPESQAVRATVRQRAIAVAETFNHIHRQMYELQEDVNDKLNVKVLEINSIANQIRDLNDQIVRIEVGKEAGLRENANDLRDRRDLLLDQLSRIVDTRYKEDQDGSMRVMIGSKTLVMGNRVSLLETKTYSETELAGLSDYDRSRLHGMSFVKWQDGSELRLASGELKSLIESVGYIETLGGVKSVKGIIPNMMMEIDHLANSIVTATNWVHLQGYGLNDAQDFVGRVFFHQEIDNGQLVPIRARDMRVSQEIIDDTNNIAASKSWSIENNAVVPGDGSHALRLAQLKHALTMITDRNYMANLQPVGLPPAPSEAFVPMYTITGPPPREFTATFDDFFRGFIGQLGIDTQEAERMAENQEMLVGQQMNRREILSGVSLDEEMTNMIRFQHAYNAAARTITTMDEMLDTLINRVGLVGR